MKVIEVTEFDPGPGNESIAKDYPGPGVYYIERTKQVYVVSKSTAWLTCFPSDYPPQIKDIAEPKPIEAQPAEAPRPASDAAEVIRALNLPLLFAAALHKEAALGLATTKGGAL